MAFLVRYTQSDAPVTLCASGHHPFDHWIATASQFTLSICRISPTRPGTTRTYNITVHDSVAYRRLHQPSYLSVQHLSEQDSVVVFVSHQLGRSPPWLYGRNDLWRRWSRWQARMYAQCGDCEPLPLSVRFLIKDNCLPEGASSSPTQQPPSDINGFCSDSCLLIIWISPRKRPVPSPSNSFSIHHYVPSRPAQSDLTPHHFPRGSEQPATSCWDIALIPQKIETTSIHKRYRTSEFLP